VLVDLEEAGQIERIALECKGAPGPWFVHRENLPRLAALEAGHWEPRTTLLSSFDNLIVDRRRTALLFDFVYQSEIYLPTAKRRYGYYVLPILHGDRLIGQIDPVLDRAHAQLYIQAVHFEASVSLTPQIIQAVTGAIEDLGVFRGARTIHSTRPLVPEEGIM
jgi:hypothetical protein